MKKVLYCNKGMTVIELVIAAAISFMILAGVLTIYQAATNQTVDNTNLIRAKDIAADISKEISEMVKYANSIEVNQYGSTEYGLSYDEPPVIAMESASTYIYPEYNSDEQLVLKFKPTGTTSYELVSLAFYEGLEVRLYFHETAAVTTTSSTEYRPNNVMDLTIAVYTKFDKQLIYKVTNTLVTYNTTVVDNGGLVVNTTDAPSHGHAYSFDTDLDTVVQYLVIK